MLRRVTWAVAVACLALAVSAVAGAATPRALTTVRTAATAKVPAGFVGVNLDGPAFPAATGVSLSAETSLMQRSGVQSVRAVFSWAYAQPYADMSDVPTDMASQFVDVGGVPTRFNQIDAVVKAAAARGLTMLPVVIYAPAWDATGASAGSLARPAQDAPYAAFLRALVRRYGPHGSFWKGDAHPVPVTHWQIWNEPDISYYWPTQPFAPTYVALLRAASTAIHSADPSATVVLAGLPNASWVDLEKIYKVRGARAAFDEVAVHPYTGKPAGVITILRFNRIVMDNNGDARKPLLATETGWLSSHGDSNREPPGLYTSEKGQAAHIAQLIPLLAANRTRLGLAGFDLYTWASTDSRTGDTANEPYQFNYAGLLQYRDDKLTAKPALAAFSAAARTVER